jgi:hypothetical protein
MIAERDRSRQSAPRHITQTTGRVAAVLGPTLNVQTAAGVVRATRAVSCLVAPERDDVVLVAGERRGRCYVLAVLERPDASDLRIQVDGNLTLELPQGRFAVAAEEGLDLLSKGAVSMVADRIDGCAREGNFTLDSITVVAGAVTTTLQRLFQAVKQAFRRVEEIEHVRAGQIDYASEGTLRLHGQNTLISARQLVKADGGQIHLG